MGSGGRRRGDKNGQKSEVLRMKSPIVENVRTSSDILLHTSRGLQLPYREKSKKSSFFTRKFQIPVFFRIFSIVELSEWSPWYTRRVDGAARRPNQARVWVDGPYGPSGRR